MNEGRYAGGVAELGASEAARVGDEGSKVDLGVKGVRFGSGDVQFRDVVIQESLLCSELRLVSTVVLDWHLREVVPVVVGLEGACDGFVSSTEGPRKRSE